MNILEMIKKRLIYWVTARNCNDILDCIVNGDSIGPWKWEKFVNEDDVSLSELFNIQKKYKISIKALIEYCILSIKENLNNQDPRTLNILIESINNDLEEYQIPKINQQSLITKELQLNNLLANSDPAYGFEIVQSILPENSELWINAFMMFELWITIKTSYGWLNQSLNALINDYNSSKNKNI